MNAKDRRAHAEDMAGLSSTECKRYELTVDAATLSWSIKDELQTVRWAISSQATASFQAEHVAKLKDLVAQLQGLVANL